MGTRRRSTLPLLIVIGALVGCSIAQAGFWTRYYPDVIVVRRSADGLWGGSRAIEWRADGPRVFTTSAVRRFAEQHGWRYIDQRDWPVAQSAQVETGRDAEPTFMTVPSVIMLFDSGSTRVHPGTNNKSVAYGYAQVAADGSTMYVFYSWGEI